MPTFVDQRTKKLLQACVSVDRNVDASSIQQESPRKSSQEKDLHGLLVAISSQESFSLERINNILEQLNTLEPSLGDSEAENYVTAIETRALIGLYAHAMEMLLNQASEADDEAQWWWRVEKSKRNSAWFLVQTLPLRVNKLLKVVLNDLRARNIPVTLSTFYPSNFRTLFPPSTRPSSLLTAAFPHLTGRPHVLARSPVQLTSDECRERRKELEKLRDDRAKVLGKLAIESAALVGSMESGVGDLHKNTGELQRAFNANASVADQVFLRNLVQQQSASSKSHDAKLATLRRPHKLLLLWPKLVFLPPIAIVGIGYLWNSRANIQQQLDDGWDTVKTFWLSWVVEPTRSIIATVRTGGDEGARVISKDALKADQDSLERMAVALSSEKLKFNEAQLAELSAQIQAGDLTPVLKIYEEDIKSPIRSAIGGTLVRSLLIQVQKMKVDVDFALSGIDKLLRSQELTFGFVGVAPALAIVYLFGGWVRRTWFGRKGKGAYGGPKPREKVWLAMRRIERLLITPPKDLEANQSNGTMTAYSDKGLSTQLSPVTQGLLLLSTTHLRAFAENHLPTSSRFREGFLNDIEDLENVKLGKNEKLVVVKRMWKSWGGRLGWYNLGVL